MLRAIDRRTHNDYAVQASLHGIKVPLRDNRERAVKEANVNFSPEEEAAMERQMIAAQRNVRERFG